MIPYKDVSDFLGFKEFSQSLKQLFMYQVSSHLRMLLGKIIWMCKTSKQGTRIFYFIQAALTLSYIYFFIGWWSILDLVPNIYFFQTIKHIRLDFFFYDKIHVASKFLLKCTAFVFGISFLKFVSVYFWVLVSSLDHLVARCFGCIPYRGHNINCYVLGNSPSLRLLCDRWWLNSKWNVSFF